MEILEIKLKETREIIYEIVRYIEKSEKHLTGQDLKMHLNNVTKNIYKASVAENKKTLLREADAELYVLKKTSQIAFNMRFIPEYRYNKLRLNLNEVGAMLNSWKIKENA